MRCASTRRLAAVVTAASAVALPLTSLTAVASASTTITTRSFGMHYINPANPYLVQFGSSRIWDMGVTWRERQPRRATTSARVLARLHNIVATTPSHGSQPMLTLGMTPAWAAHKCNHYYA